MRYFVITDDGNRYGPTDLAGLNQWIQEGRLLPTTLLEEEGSGARIAASAVQGLEFPVQAPGPAAGPAPGGGMAPPSSGPGANPYGTPYQRPMPGYGSGNDGQTEMIISWVLGGVGLVLCCCYGWILNIVGIVLGAKSNGKGNRAGQAAMIFNIVALVIGIGWLILAETALKPFAEQMQRQMLRQQQQQQQQAQPQQPSLPTTTAGGGG